MATKSKDFLIFGIFAFIGFLANTTTGCCNAPGREVTELFTHERDAAVQAAASLGEMGVAAGRALADDYTVVLTAERFDCGDQTGREGCTCETGGCAVIRLASDTGWQGSALATHEYVHTLFPAEGHSDRFWRVEYKALADQGLDSSWPRIATTHDARFDY